MFRKLLATTALAAIMTSGALAQDQKAAPDAMDNRPLFSTEENAGMESETGFFEASETQILASDLLGQTVYNGATDEAESVGDINDVVMGPDGNAEAVVIGVGGFLGIGEKEVAVDFTKISWIDRDGSRWLIIEASKEELEGAPDFDRTAFDVEPAEETEQTAMTGDNASGATATDPAMQQNTAQTEQPADAAEQPEETAQTEQPAATEESTTETASAEGEATEPVDEENQTAEARDEQIDTGETAAINPDSWKVVTNEELSAETLLGTRVYGADDADLGEIGDVIVTADGQFQAYIVDVGGFLGVGEKPVALDASELEVMADENGNLHIRTSFTQEQLEAQAAYDEKAFEENPDDVLLR